MTAILSTPEATARRANRITLRPFIPEDYPACVAIGNANYPEYPSTLEEWRFDDEKRDPKYLFARFVAINEPGEVIGWAQYSQHPFQYHPRKFGLEISVAPDWQRQGVGSALYSRLLSEIERFEPISVRAHTREDMTASVAFLARRGFTEAMRDWESRLNVAALDLSRFDGASERIAEQGIVVRTLRELEGTPGRDRKLWELDCAVSLDMPSSDTPTSPEFEDWTRHTFENPNLIPDAYFIAVDTAAGDRYVGVSQLWTSKGSDDLFTGATGVLREYRRRGIALALKIRAMEYAKTTGCATVRTWNAQSNRAMLSINEALGFEKQPAWIDYVKVLRQEEGVAPASGAAFTLRPFTPDDYEACATVYNATYPDYPETAEAWRFHDANRDPKCRHARIVAEEGGRIVGLGVYSQSSGMYHPRKFSVDICVPPAERGHGLGRALYAALTDALTPFDPIALSTDVRDDNPVGLRFAESRGFVEVMREQESELVLAGFDSAAFAVEVDAVERQGIRFRSAAELLAEDPEGAKRRMFDLGWEVSLDVPHPDELTRPDFDVWARRFDNPEFLPGGNYYAIDASTGEYVGISTLSKAGDSPDLNTGLTGVLRSHRKKGIATALKVKALTFAKEGGWRAVKTWNEVNNAGMLGINFRLGFVRRPAWLQMTRVIKEED